MTDRPPLPPFDRESALTKVQAAEDAWNTRDPERVALIDQLLVIAIERSSVAVGYTDQKLAAPADCSLGIWQVRYWSVETVGKLARLLSGGVVIADDTQCESDVVGNGSIENLRRNCFPGMRLYRSPQLPIGELLAFLVFMLRR